MFSSLASYSFALEIELQSARIEAKNKIDQTQKSRINGLDNIIYSNIRYSNKIRYHNGESGKKAMRKWTKSESNERVFVDFVW